jgi:hypothetical protein
MKAGKISSDSRDRVDNSGASDLAVRALIFLAADEERVSRFLALTGLDPSEIRARLGERGFQLAVLDHLAGDEALLIAFAEAEAIRPEAVGRARRALGGGEE